MSTQIEALSSRAGHRVPAIVRRPGLLYVAGVLALAGAYYAAAKAGQSLSYTGSVAAIWPPAGLGIAALYLWGVRWWPGIFLGDLIVNLELLYGHDPLPLGTLVGQQFGNMAEIIVGALLMRRLIGLRAELDRTEQVTGMFAALAVATAISATVGTLSMLAGNVIDAGEAASFWRTWWLGDLSGGLTVVPFLIVWAARPGAAWRRMRTYEGALLLAAVLLLAGVAVSTNATVTYLVFPVLIWVAWRFRAPGATLAVLIVAGTTIAMTAHNVGPFSRQQIDSKTLGTQLYICVAALTTFLLAALLGERERSAAALVEAKRREGQQALDERRRIARDLHDSVSQALFSTILQTRTAEKALRNQNEDLSGPIARALATIGELTRGAQNEMRGLISDLRRDPVSNGLMAALHDYADHVSEESELDVDVTGPVESLPISHDTETELFGIVREALVNVVRHARAANASVRVRVGPDHVLLQVSDDGCGFDPQHRESGHYGLESMQARADEIGAELSISSSAELGTEVRIEAPAGAEAADGA
jgi:signal transduction histidine kinase